MEEFSKEGRKLRPRKTTAPHSERVDIFTESTQREREHGPRGERRSHEGGFHRGTGAHPHTSRPYGERRTEGSFPRGEGRREGSFPRREGRPGGYSSQRSTGDRPARPGQERSWNDRPQGEERRPRPAFGARGKGRPGGRNAGPRHGQRPAFFSRESAEGVERMVSRRSSEDRRRMEGGERQPEIIQNEIRLNKFIANSGVCSRREADTLIQAGVVTVNGEVVTELGTKVNVFEDDVRFNGERLKGEEKVYIVMNKPRGFVTTASDPHAEKTVLDLLKNCTARVYPVGRLDNATTGVLMLTNDGEIAERLTHPAYDKKKIYQVALDRPLAEADFQQVLDGISLEDGDIRADALEYIDETDKRKVGIEIHSGRNRIVRRIFEHLGYTVKALDRVYFAGLTKRGLKKGEWRYLSEQEINILKMGAYI